MAKKNFFLLPTSGGESIATDSPPKHVQSFNLDVYQHLEIRRVLSNLSVSGSGKVLMKLGGNVKN